ncbi:hypothetical protein MH928_17270 [Flavobacterium sp. WW92]|uniref:hypothetical protein n=1 Tax=unclassified Flavobacterium TaxID=196869 RepID=UPI002224DD3D|nr:MULTISPECIES: hypothetical protein [unclassified Flavobacterium]WDO13059.1 hypothetical protein MH928_17270 [Flavobacterium sp. WW92]
MPSKITEISIVAQIKDWCKKGKNNCPNDLNVSLFVREIIPVLESYELRISLLEEELLRLNKNNNKDA